MTTAWKKAKGNGTRTDVVNSSAFEGGIEEVELESCTINAHSAREYAQAIAATITVKVWRNKQVGRGCGSESHENLAGRL
jgi:hypothetical protein